MAATGSKRRYDAADAYVWALRRGEATAAERAGSYLASDVALEGAGGTVVGHEAVLRHITGDWPSTPVLQFGGWSNPTPSGDSLVVAAEFPAMGAAPSGATISFAFNDRDEIVRVREAMTTPPRPEPDKEIPLFVRGIIDGALANGTPMVVGYVDAAGEASLSLRGSVQVYSPTQLCIWLRSAEGGLATAAEINATISLLYRDSKLRTTLLIKGRGHIERDQEARRRVYELSPEVEQMHSPERTGAALVIDVAELRGTSPRGPVLVQP